MPGISWGGAPFPGAADAGLIPQRGQEHRRHHSLWPCPEAPHGSNSEDLVIPPRGPHCARRGGEDTAAVGSAGGPWEAGREHVCTRRTCLLCVRQPRAVSEFLARHPCMMGCSLPPGSYSLPLPPCARPHGSVLGWTPEPRELSGGLGLRAQERFQAVRRDDTATVRGRRPRTPALGRERPLRVTPSPPSPQSRIK